MSKTKAELLKVAREHTELLEWLEDEYPRVLAHWKMGQVEPNDLLFPGMATEYGSRPPTR